MYMKVPADYARIQEAIDAAPVGSTILLESGEYNESLHIHKSLSILASSDVACHCEQGPIVTIHSGTVKLVGIHFQGRKKASAMHMQGGTIQIFDCIFEAES